VPLNEKSLIDRIRRQARAGPRGLTTGIGDDCAVLRIPLGHEVLVTTDFSLEGIHFRREWHPPESVGHRCLTRGLSDIAAMGGEPIAAFLSLAVPRALPQRWVDGFIKGLLALADQFNVTLAGGDIAESPAGILADIMVLGSAPRDKAILRSGARPGDRIFVSGKLGGSADAVRRLMNGEKLKPRDHGSHFFPQPQLALGNKLRGSAAAMIDLSDGLSTDLAHICEESGVGAEISQDVIPLATIGESQLKVGLDLALHGGEDYELLFTARRSVPKQIAGVPITEIGRITRNRGVFLISDGKRKRLPAKGWQHFKS
jgi:thiamine-monophosphate kinase